MSVAGQKRGFRDVGCESALPPRTDIVSDELQGSSRDQLYPPMTGNAVRLISRRKTKQAAIAD
jgi:hypothetical protein